MTIMKTLGSAFVLLISSVLSILAQDDLPHFADHKVSLYQGKTLLPKWIGRGNQGEWRDGLGKLVDAPEVNFAGKYFVAVHSCGNGCRYYTLTDLSSGRELNALDVFAAGENPPKTSDGHEYISILYYRPDSRMLVAQYLIDPQRGLEQCRERTFVFQSGRLRPITGTRQQCTKLQ